MDPTVLRASRREINAAVTAHCTLSLSSLSLSSISLLSYFFSSLCLPLSPLSFTPFLSLCPFLLSLLSVSSLSPPLSVSFLFLPPTPGLQERWGKGITSRAPQPATVISSHIVVLSLPCRYPKAQGQADPGNERGEEEIYRTPSSMRLLCSSEAALDHMLGWAPFTPGRKSENIGGQVGQSGPA